MLNIKDLTRNAKLINSKLHVQKNKSVFTDLETKLIIPKFFMGSKLLELGERFYSVGIVMIQMGKTYSVFSAPSLIEIAVTTYREIDVRSESGITTPCIELTYPRGMIVFESLESIKDVTFPYYVANKIIKQGGAIPFFNTNDFQTMFEKSALIGGLSLPEYAFVNLYSSLVLRSAKDRTLPMRLSKSNDYVNIPFNSVILSTTNTLSKISGAYLNDGIQSAIVNKNERTSTLEEVLRA